MAFFNSRKRNMFGPYGYGTPGYGDGNEQEMSDVRLGILDSPQQPQERQRGFWGGGEKFGWKDGAAGVLAALSDAFMQQGGGQGGAVQGLAGRRENAMEKALKAQEQAAAIAAARQRGQSAGLDPAKADLLAHGDAKYGDLNGGSPEKTTDNAGNVWVKGPDGRWQLDFVDQTPKTYFNNGMQIDIPNTYAGANVGTRAPGYPVPKLRVGNEELTPPVLGQPEQPPTLEEIRAERQRRRQQRGY